MSSKLEVLKGPDRFRGVTTNLNNQPNIVHPNFVFRDAEIVVGSTAREEDRLALSSTNAYLSTEQRKAATVIRRALERCRSTYNGGERDSSKLGASMRAVIESEQLARVDYIAITDTVDLDSIETIGQGKPTLVSLAVFIGEIRLADNVVLNGEL